MVGMLPIILIVPGVYMAQLATYSYIVIVIVIVWCAFVCVVFY